MSAKSTQGEVVIGSHRLRCALGRGGSRAIKREGDGATPIGVWRPLRIFYRADAVVRPRTSLPVSPIRRDDGWCDAPADRNYNRRVRLPYPASTERLWRADRLYDIVVVLDHNTRPRLRNRGSAIFIHLARDNFSPTEGCIALRARDLGFLLSHLTCRSRIVVHATPRRAK